MSGHFIHWDLYQWQLDQLQNINGNIGLSRLHHQPPGWTQNTRAVIGKIKDGVMQNAGLPNRGNLPPHKYIEIPSGSFGVNQPGTQLLWFEFLVRPNLINIGLTALAPAAAVFWPGNKKQAVTTQNQIGKVQIEVYYFEGNEIR